MTTTGSLEKAVVLLVARATDHGLGATLSAAGARVIAMDVGELVAEVEAVDAVVFMVGDEPERFTALAHALAPQHATPDVPALALVSGDVPVRRLSSLGPLVVLDDRTPTPDVLRSLATAIDRARARRDAGEIDGARLRALSERLAATQREVTTTAHDVRALCGVAMGYAANLRDGFAGTLSPSQASHVTQVLAALGDIRGILERFGGMARAREEDAPPPSRRAPVRRRMLVDLVDLASGLVALFGSVAADKDLSLTMRASGPVRAFCDPTQVKQALTNLLVNALKFTPAGGMVTLEVALDSGPEGQDIGDRARARIVVRDTGPGVPPDERDRIFERGYRANAHRDVPGSGIGLAVVREVAGLHGGSISVEDGVGSGAAFVLSLPLDLRRRREGAVLFVDDAAAAQRLVAALADTGVDSLVTTREDALRTALESGCEAVVALPRDSFGASIAKLQEGVGSRPRGVR